MSLESEAHRRIHAGLTFLQSEQGGDGNFVGLASADPHDFSRSRQHPTIFATTLIASCLSEVDGGEAVRQPAAKFLVQHKSRSWSWNYWRRDSRQYTQQPFPDDLDDTACASAALWQYDRQLVGGTAQAELAKHLISVEVRPGGPYRSWLAANDAAEVWRDVDVAVNANIGWMLHLLGVKAPGIEAFLEDALTTKRDASRYYCGPEPVWYFIARWYRGTAVSLLKQRVEDAVIRHSGGALTTALLVSAGLHVGVARNKLKPLVHQLLESKESAWPAQALYYEPPVQGVTQYAGSRSLTTAFVIEALQDFVRPAGSGETKPSPVRTRVIEQARRYGADLPAPMAPPYESVLKAILQADHRGEITAMATVTAQALGAELPEKTLVRLGLGSLYGWMAYTLYDNIWDGETGAAARLGLANTLARQSLSEFQQTVPELTKQVEDVFKTMDAATTWEVTQARTEPGIFPSDFPDYHDWHQLGDKSAGHALAALGVALAAGRGEETCHPLHRFFQHFLIARQLNDDAHDWEKDLERGHLSVVVVLVLREAGSMQDKDKLRQLFWDRVFDGLAERIFHEIRRARQALTAIPHLADSAALEQCLSHLERATQQAIDERGQARDFIKTFAQF